MKTYISDSLISEALIMMSVMKQNNCFDILQIENIKTYYGINKSAALSLANQCEWIVLHDGVTYEITPYGSELLKHFDGMQVSISMYRDILRNYIKACRPIWARRTPYGRNEAYRIMSDEEQVCFQKAGLMNTPVTKAEVKWWDSIAEIERQEIEHAQDNVGRKGEELTIAYEKKRTKTEPVWESIDSNLAGYDILSQMSENDSSKILIEVKSSSQRLDNASMYISHNEWSFASAGCNQSRYYFYVWLLEKHPRLAVIPYIDVTKHIPFDNGMGEWNDVSIPFSAFQDDFCDVEIDG